MGSFFQDVRYGLKLLRKSPGFTTVAILTLALGIGANTAIFSIVNSVLLRSLPFRDPDRLVKVSFDDPGLGLHDVPYSVPELEDLRSRSGVFDDVSVVFPTSTNLTGAKQPERLEALGVSPNYFSMFGVTPQVGRLFGPQDVALGFAEAAVISDGEWRRSFGADPGIVGRRIPLDNDLYTIVGVVPPGFRHPGKTIATDVEVWVTTGFSADPFPKPARSIRFLPGAMARLKPDVTVQQAQAQLSTMASQLRNDFPTDYPAASKWSIRIQPLQESLVGDIRPMLLVLMGTVILIILIASVNIANLLLARASGRQREMAVRLAVGASRVRMIRQMLTESLLLSFIAGIAGVVAAAGTLGFIVRFVPSKIPRLSEVNVDWRVLLFGLLISLITGLVFGFAPAIQSAKADLVSAIREGARGSGYGRKTSRLRGALIISELALAVVLLIGAGLLLRTFRFLLREDPGFNPDKVVAASIWLPNPNDPKTNPYPDIGSQAVFAREFQRRMGAIPGIETAALTSDLPGSPPRYSRALIIEDMPINSSQQVMAEIIRISPDYFKVIQCPLVRGRVFSEGDEAGKEMVVIVDETTAHRYWPDRDAVGRRLKIGQNPNAPWMTVVGIMKDIKHDGLDKDAIPHIYTSVYQQTGRNLSVVLRTDLPPAQLESEIRDQIHAVDPGLPVFSVKSMNEVLEASLAPRRFSAELVALFAALALLLASIGIYGLLAYMVGQRSHEIGIRMALGARRDHILKLILRQGIFLAGAGVSAGLVAAVAAAPLIATLLYGVHPIDPVVFLSVALILLIVSFLASFIPAYRATKVNPIVALREG
jgi:putative ABC transport system permease protein